MPVPVPSGVVFSYNSFVFGPYCKTTVTEEPMTGDNRTVKYSKITIKANGFITSLDADAFAAAQTPPLAAGLPLGPSGEFLALFSARATSALSHNDFRVD